MAFFEELRSTATLPKDFILDTQDCLGKEENSNIFNAHHYDDTETFVLIFFNYFPESRALGDLASALVQVHSTLHVAFAFFNFSTSYVTVLYFVISDDHCQQGAGTSEAIYSGRRIHLCG